MYILCVLIFLDSVDVLNLSQEIILKNTMIASGWMSQTGWKP